jgi:hypothetical protein
MSLQKNTILGLIFSSTLIISCQGWAKGLPYPEVVFCPTLTLADLAEKHEDGSITIRDNFYAPISSRDYDFYIEQSYNRATRNWSDFGKSIFRSSPVKNTVKRILAMREEAIATLGSAADVDKEIFVMSQDVPNNPSFKDLVFKLVSTEVEWKEFDLILSAPVCKYTVSFSGINNVDSRLLKDPFEMKIEFWY